MQLTQDELLAAESLSEGADAVIYPSGQLGLLAERGWIAPLPADYATNRELAWSDTFELLQVAETRWGQTPYAVPFGSTLLTCYYRSDLFDRFHKRPPATWQEYQELAEFFAKRENLPGVELPDRWSGTVEPLASGWAGRVLLARAAAYARHRDHYSTLFKIDSMQPLIAGAPFVARSKSWLPPPESRRTTAWSSTQPHARASFLAGHAALALAVPGHCAALTQRRTQRPCRPWDSPSCRARSRSITWPAGAGRIARAKKARTCRCCGFAGRLGSITRRRSKPTRRYSCWPGCRVASGAPAVSSASAATTLYRRIQLRAPQPWVDPLYRCSKRQCNMPRRCAMR